MILPTDPEQNKMSFWPFSNSYNSSNQLLKFLDTVIDFSHVTVDSILDDKSLQHDFMDELKRLASKNNEKDSYQIVQLLHSDNLLVKSNVTSDSTSVSSNSEPTGGNQLSKNAREAKFIELILQPHILSGFLDYIVESVEFYHLLATKEVNKVEHQMSNEAMPDGENENNKSVDIEANDIELKEDRLRRCIQFSADVLSVDMWVVSNQIIETPMLIKKLWLIISIPLLKESSPSVSYLVQILDHLMESNPVKLLNFIRKQDDLVDIFLGKVEIPILMDFLIKIIQKDKPDSPTGILEVLHQQDMIPKLINILKPDLTSFDASLNYIPDPETLFRQTAATELAKALVTISSNASLAVDLETNIGPNQLTRKLASSEIVQSMIDDIILFRIPDKYDPSVAHPNKHGISNCVSILIELIRKNNSDYDVNYGTSPHSGTAIDNAAEVNVQTMFHWLKDFDHNPPGPRDPVYLGDLLSVFTERQQSFSDLISGGTLTESADLNFLGMTKFKISELIAELLHCSNMILLNSRKIASIMHIRDKIRSLQLKNIQIALNDPLFEHDILHDLEEVADVTLGIDDVSLKDVHIRDFSPGKTGRTTPDKLNLENLGDVVHIEPIEDMEYSDSDDDEPIVSTEKPFVCQERDLAFRKEPSVGDHFKISLIDLGILNNIIAHFTEFKWHNFFHNVVFDLIQQIFNGKLNSYNSFLIVDLFRKDKCDIVNMILSSFLKEREPRPGYMGHLILISEEVVKFTSLYKPALISPILVEAVGSKEWEWFVDNILLKTRELYNAILGADPEYLRSDGCENGHDERCEEDSFGFDSSTVGYLDIDQESFKNGNAKKPVIILGDSYNHEEFVALSASNDDGDDEDDGDETYDFQRYANNSKLSSVEIKNMSPKLDFESNDEMIYDDFESNKYGGFQDNELQDNDYLENLLGSSSSDDEDGGDDDEDDDDDGHQLRRIPRHQG